MAVYYLCTIIMYLGNCGFQLARYRNDQELNRQAYRPMKDKRLKTSHVKPLVQRWAVNY